MIDSHFRCVVWNCAMRCVLFIPLVALCIVTAAVSPAQPPAAPPTGVSNWPFDEITLTNGAKFQGLILSELPNGIQFQSVSRPANRPTVTLTSFFTKAEIASVKRLSDKDR